MDLWREERRRNLVDGTTARQAVRPANRAGVRRPSASRSRDHSPSAPISARPCCSPVRIAPDVVMATPSDPATKPSTLVPSLTEMPGVALDRRQQHGLQIGAVDHPVGSVVARRAAWSRCHGRNRHPQPHAVRGHDGRRQRLGEPERGEHARRVRKELDAGADLLEALRLLEQDDRKAVPRDRERRRQAADARSGDENLAGGMAQCSGSGRLQIGNGTFRRTRLAWRQRGIEAIERRAIRADDLVVGAHVEKHMGMVERREVAPTHMNSRAPISMTETPASLWKWGTIRSAIAAAVGSVANGRTIADPAAERNQAEGYAVAKNECREIRRMRFAASGGI